MVRAGRLLSIFLACSATTRWPEHRAASSHRVALDHANIVDLWRMDAPLVTSRATELLGLAETHGYPIWQALALVFRGSVTVQLGDVHAGLAETDDGFVLYNELTTPPIFSSGPPSS